MRNARRARLVLTLLLLAAFTLITLDYRSGAGNGLRNMSERAHAFGGTCTVTPASEKGGTVVDWRIELTAEA